jgi:hypothetical protein
MPILAARRRHVEKRPTLRKSSHGTNTDQTASRTASKLLPNPEGRVAR